MFLKSIKDISIADGVITISRSTSLTSKEIENQIALITYSPSNYKKLNSIENTQMPPYIQVFYYLFFKTLRVPLYDEYLHTYFEWLGCADEELIRVGETYLPRDGIVSRMNRTYPSLLRDLHFLYLMNESACFQNVVYSMEKDYFNGLDIHFSYKNTSYYLSLFVDTSRGNYFKARKKARHNYQTVREIEFNVDLTTLNRVGDIYLLNAGHIVKIIDRIEN